MAEFRIPPVALPLPRYATELILLPIDPEDAPVEGAPVVTVSGIAHVWRDDFEQPVPFWAVPGHAVEPYAEPRHRLDWQPSRADGVAFRVALERPAAVTLSAEQAGELRRLASRNPRDEWDGSDLFDYLAAAVLRYVGSGS